MDKMCQNIIIALGMLIIFVIGIVFNYYRKYSTLPPSISELTSDYIGYIVIVLPFITAAGLWYYFNKVQVAE